MRKMRITVSWDVPIDLENYPPEIASFEQALEYEKENLPLEDVMSTYPTSSETWQLLPGVCMQELWED